MADYDNAVTVTAGLTCSALEFPPIGTQQMSASIGYDAGTPAKDEYVVVSHSAPTTLVQAAQSKEGMVFVYNPSTNAYAVGLFIGTTAVGKLFPGFGAVMPLSDEAELKATSDTTAQTVGVTYIQVAKNS